MAVKALIFGNDNLFQRFKPFYDKEVEKGNLEIIGYADATKDDFTIYSSPDFSNISGGGGGFDIVVVLSQNNFYSRMKFLESKGVSRKNIVDGTIFMVTNFDFPKFIKEGVVFGVFDMPRLRNDIDGFYTRTYNSKTRGISVNIGVQSYIVDAVFTGAHTDINIGNFTSISWEISFNLNLTLGHNYHNITSADLSRLDWAVARNFFMPGGRCKIEIGNDVWIGKGVHINHANNRKPLVIGDGAVVATDSVVVSNVPPYAIVGGNPAKVIKYRFPEKIIEALLRIKWWNWDIDRIHDNFKYFNDIEKFVEMNDPKLHPENFSVDLNKPFRIVPR